MSLNKAIKYGKEHRKEYHGAKAVDKTCRNHGSCPYCRDNRMYHNNKERERMDYEDDYDDFDEDQDDFSDGLERGEF